MKIEQTDSYSISIYVAGDLPMIRHYCREFCMEGLCVTITPCDFAYTGGMEAGAKIGLVNYPRFSSTPEVIHDKARRLAEFLLEKLYQHSVLIDAPESTTWMSKREEG